MFISSKNIFITCALTCIFLLLFGIYLENAYSLIPCPLCMLQRFIFIMIAAFSLLAFFHSPAKFGLRIYALINLIFSIMGILLAGRQIWLQHLPADQVPACGPSLHILFQSLPLIDALQTSILGTGDCAKVQWIFLGLNIAEWSMIFFIIFSCIMFYIIFSPKKNYK